MPHIITQCVHAILFVCCSTNVEPDFELKLEVYAVMMESDLTIASTPRKIKNTIHSSISRTVGKRLAASLKDELNNTKMYVPKFENIKKFCFRNNYSINTNIQFQWSKIRAYCYSLSEAIGCIGFTAYA